MKNLHLLPDTFFSQPYVELINNHFKVSDNLFIIFKLNGEKPRDYPNHSNVICILYPGELTDLFTECHKADNIFLHGLSSHKIIRYLFFHQQIARKCHWLIWGADLYYYRTPKRGVYDILFEIIRRRVIRKFRSIISYTPADIKLVKKIYRIKNDVNKCFFYPGVLRLEETPDELFFVEQKDIIRIVLGNSSTPG